MFLFFFALLTTVDGQGFHPPRFCATTPDVPVKGMFVRGDNISAVQESGHRVLSHSPIEHNIVWSKDKSLLVPCGRVTGIANWNDTHFIIFDDATFQVCSHQVGCPLRCNFQDTKKLFKITIQVQAATPVDLDTVIVIGRESE